MALPLHIPPCVLGPHHTHHPPPPGRPLRITIQGPLSCVQKLLPDVKWHFDTFTPEFPQPAGPRLARIAFEQLYKEEVAQGIIRDLIVRDEYLAWVIEDGRPLNYIDYYGVIFDYLVPSNDLDPEVLAINLIEMDNDGGAFADEVLSFKVNPADYTGRKVLAVPRCCQKKKGTTDRIRTNELVIARDQQLQDGPDLSMAASEPVSLYLELIEEANSCPDELLVGPEAYRLYLPFSHQPRGILHPDTVKLIPWTTNFNVSHDKRRIDLVCPAGLSTSDFVNAAFRELVQLCIDQNAIPALSGRRQEEFRGILGAPHSVEIYRHAQSLFGFIGQGAHLTAYVRTPQGLKLWVSRRSATIDIAPNMLDNTAAGAVPAHLTPLETITEEAFEEASLPRSLVQSRVHAAGTLTYASLPYADSDPSNKSIVQDVIYVYDLELEDDEQPQVQDDEVSHFYLMGIPEIMSSLSNKEFKTNCALVIIDFLIRHGVLTAENTAEYVDIATGLHRALPLTTGRHLAAASSSFAMSDALSVG